MSITLTGPSSGPTASPVRRVRHQAREVLAMMAFSAVTSVVLTGVAVLALQLSR